MAPTQLDLFADPMATRSSFDATRAPRVDAASLSDAALIAALPGAALADARALAAEAGRRRLGEAVPALTALCNRLAGFGAESEVLEQAAALEALAAIGGAEAARSVGRLIERQVVQGPNLAAAALAASKLGVIIPRERAPALLRHADPTVRAAICACVRASPEVVAALIELLGDFDREVAIASACALGRMGKAEALATLKRCLTERPSPRVVEAVTTVADDDAIVLLARVARGRPDLVVPVLAALDEIDRPRAANTASALRRWLVETDPG